MGVEKRVPGPNKTAIGHFPTTIWSPRSGVFGPQKYFFAFPDFFAKGRRGGLAVVAKAKANAKAAGPGAQPGFII